jgi:ring-1,2-phenylacetyl-CoA epoxidase subunit PaaC
MTGPSAHLVFVLRLADDHLILGHRLSEWCGHAPLLEEDLAMANIALDLIGQARALYDHAGGLEGRGRSEDDFAYLRRERDYLNCLLAEQPNGDFARTMLRQLYFSAWMAQLWQALAGSSDAPLAGIAGKAAKETAYHLRHSGEWVVRLGDGTDESRRRTSAAAEHLAPCLDELFADDPVTTAVAEAGIAPQPSSLRPAFAATVSEVFARAGLEPPTVPFALRGGREGRHGEAMGHLLAELQFMQRAYPGAHW